MLTLKTLISTLENFVGRINKIGQIISILILAILMFLTFGDVLSRYIFQSPIYGTYELTGLGLALLIFFSLGFAQQKKENISVDFLIEKFPQKLKDTMELIFNSIFFLLVLLLAIQMFKHSQRMLIGNDTTADLSLPLYIFVITAGVGLIFLSITFVLDILKTFLRVMKKDDS